MKTFNDFPEPDGRVRCRIACLIAGALTGFLILACPSASRAQTNPDFNVALRVDFSGAEQLLDFFDRQTANTERVAGLRGNRLAAATSVMLARTSRTDEDFQRELERVRDGGGNDIYGLLAAKSRGPALRKLLTEIHRRQLDRRVVATIAAYFPAMGNERAAAVVRRVVWNGDTPSFVGENEGAPVVLLNLARVVENNSTVESQVLELLATLAHECFHAVYSVYRQVLPDTLHTESPGSRLLDLVQNEGVAYYLSLQLHLGGETPSQTWMTATMKSIETLNRVYLELHSPQLTRSRARELMMNANLSGSFEGNYGASAGMRMAYEIDTRLGRQELAATLAGGGRAFIEAYARACQREGSLPPIDPRVLDIVEKE